MEFQKYQHVERFGIDETEHIELGECYVFPKLDGTNASVWLRDGVMCCGSRNRELSLENDNAGFMAWATQSKPLLSYLKDNPTHRLYGEWLVPHSINTYKKDAWRRFYVFDVTTSDGEDVVHLHYNLYKPVLESHGVDYIPPVAIIRNADYEQLVEQLAQNVFMVEDGAGAGEGIVLKRYDYRNKYGRQTWAKIVTSEFKEKHAKTMVAPEKTGAKMVEAEIADKYVTKALVEKEYAKIHSDGGWTSRCIPRLLSTVFHALLTEETWHFVKEHNNPKVDFKRLQRFTYAAVKVHAPHLFQ